MHEHSFTLFCSNRLETLADRLTHELSTPPGLPDPFEPEIIVVQSSGMKRWISMELAKRAGVSANISFPFPVALVYELFRSVLPDITDAYPFDQNVLAWNFFKALPELTRAEQSTHGDDFSPIAEYLSPKPGLKEFQLAERVAFLLDQYFIFRPEMVRQWDAGELSFTTHQARAHECWQARLWQHISKDRVHESRPALKERFHELLHAQAPTAPLPRRISVFGISSLPKFYLDVLHHASKFCQVSIYFLNPCQEYWGDIRSKRELARIAKKHGDQGLEQDLEIHPLLTSMGGLGRDFFDTLLTHYNPEIVEDYAPPFSEGELSLLACVQEDILELQTRVQREGEKKLVFATDDSLRVHACHSPMREMEVLYDTILAILQDAPHITPRDILVMTPNIDDYAPYVQAVFNCPPEESMRVPFSMDDRAGGRSVTVRTLLDILDLANARFEASKVLAILESAPVCAAFEFSAQNLEQIRTWVLDTGICWGIDAHFRQQSGVPAFKENSWESGLERLLLGYVFPSTSSNSRAESEAESDSKCSKASALFHNILPYDHVEGTNALLLGRFLECMRLLTTHVLTLSNERSPKEWQHVLNGLLDDLFADNGNESQGVEFELNQIRQCLAEITQQAQSAEVEHAVPLEVIKHVLEEKLKSSVRAQGFMARGVTFCSMVPMRSIPFKVICLVGMNDANYPRQDKKPGFDLMAKHPRPGDRSARVDDKYLFLEAFISAREKLHISYVGQNIKDNAVIPPSVLVNELLDYVTDNYAISGQNQAGAPTLADVLRVRHRLQAFHPAYFASSAPESELFSFSKENLQGMLELREEPKSVMFASNALEPPEDNAWHELTQKDLERFFLNPCRFFLQKRLGIQLGMDTQITRDSEHLAGVDGLDRYALNQELIARLLQKGTHSAVAKQQYELMRASNSLPPGPVGKEVFSSLYQEAAEFTDTIRAAIGDAPRLSPATHALSLGPYTVRVERGRVFGNTNIRYRYARLNGKDVLSTWLEHLALHAAGLLHADGKSLYIGQDKSVTFHAPESEHGTVQNNSQDLLFDLVEMLHQGLCVPLPFSPKMGWDFLMELEKKGSIDAALAKAHSTWEGNDHVPGEGQDPYMALIFQDIPPFSTTHREDFVNLAQRVFGPMLQWMEA